MRFLRQSTASQEILLGPFVATADGTAQTGLTIANTDIKLLYAGGTSETNKNSGGGTHIAGGRYSAVLDATDTATVGILEVSVAPASGIPWSKSYYVLEEAIYDALFAASANAWSGAAGSTTLTALASGSITAAVVATGAIDADAIADNAIDAGAIASNALALAKFATDARQAFGLGNTGTLSGTHSDTTADLGTNAPSTDITGQTLFFSDHDLSRLVTAYNTGTGVATFSSIGVTLANGNTWYRYPTAPSSGGAGLDAAGVRAAIGMSSANLDTQLSTIDTVVDAILVDTGTTLDGRIPAALVSGRMDCTIDGTGMEAGAVTAVQSGLATSAALTTVDTVVDAIKVQTDKFANLPVLTEGGTGGQGFGAP